MSAARRLILPVFTPILYFLAVSLLVEFVYFYLSMFLAFDSLSVGSYALFNFIRGRQHLSIHTSCCVGGLFESNSEHTCGVVMQTAFPCF